MWTWTEPELDRFACVYNYASKHADWGFWTSFIAPRFPARTVAALKQKLTELRHQGDATAAGRRLLAGTYDPDLLRMPRELSQQQQQLSKGESLTNGGVYRPEQLLPTGC